MENGNSELEKSRDTATRRLMMCAWAGVPVVALVVLLTGSQSWVAVGISAAFAGLGQVGMRTGGRLGRIAVGQGMVGQAIGLTAAFAGHPWQLDAHMSFFAVLAAMVALVGVRAILFAAGTIVLHHVSLSILLPSLVYPSSDILANIERSLFHGAIVLVETAALVIAVRVRLKMDAESQARNAALAEAKQTTDEALEKARAAQSEAEADRVEAEAARSRAEAATATVQAQQAEADAAQQRMREAEEREAESRRKMTEQLGEVLDKLKIALRGLSNGDLNTRIGTAFAEEYEPLRADFNEALTQLSEALRDVADYTDRIRNDASQINSSSEELSIRTERQAATLQETAAALTALTASVDEAASMAEDASSYAGEAQDKASAGGEIVERTVAAMGLIESSSGKIARITNVIDDIAFQTNLLALNAGVEAARAGDAGRGFAVVASEVRALAQRSSEAAREISQLISSSGEQVQEGVQLVGRTGEALEGIVTAVRETAERIGRIATETRAQSGSLSEITSAANELDKVTKQNAAMFEETTAAVGSMNAGAEGLAGAVAAFRFGDDDSAEDEQQAWDAARRSA
ncbi:methyl-accepting chemotaxis protein [Psychromarinibacter halotolerans]|uniref:Methyl-accepting chemotaxis protein n=1 Tax=Psychromarinibacter halotolerans TaxID=1775175 RepID=A0ABV7H077_9RHOB|nr:methyl-accepting chemotaxis protein [Psychromarinibacter halotolerans]MDF0596378.1 methyl-accepting chemotaxis protein [Psychromarinibacter halotolerans]